MTGRLAVDFGTSNTLLALWDDSLQACAPIHLTQFGKEVSQGSTNFSLIPSLIHYEADGRRWLGNQVIEKGLYASPNTFRWMKRYISHRSPLHVRIGSKDITPIQAGTDFLSTLLAFAAQEYHLEDNEVALSVPVEAYEHYESWLSGVIEHSGFSRYRLIDEPSAASLGYNTHTQPGSVFLVFDFGGGTLHAAVVLMDEQHQDSKNRRCRVLGKAGKDIGGATIDRWLFQEVLRQNRLTDSDDVVLPLSNRLLVECERVKESLSTVPFAELDLDGRITARFTRENFDDLLDQHDFIAEINRTVRAALASAQERGYAEDRIQSVLMVGGSSQIPAVQRALRQMFGKERVYSDCPLDAVARGAAAFISGVDFFDYIQHDYAIRYIDPQKGDYDYRTIVQRGTPYPTREPVAKLTLKASYNDQKRLGISIYEMGQRQSQNGSAFELIFDPSGAARVTPLTPDQQEQQSRFWMNENNPTFLCAEPPSQKGQARFQVEFYIDANKRLSLTAIDLITGRLALDHHPVVKLV